MSRKAIFQIKLEILYVSQVAYGKLYTGSLASGEKIEAFWNVGCAMLIKVSRHGPIIIIVHVQCVAVDGGP